MHSPYNYRNAHTVNSTKYGIYINKELESQEIFKNR